MQDLASDVLGPATTIFAIASMLHVGLTWTLEQILEPLSNAKSVILALIANVVLSPLLAWGSARLLDLDEPYRNGLLVVSAAAGAPARLLAWSDSRKIRAVGAGGPDPVAPHRVCGVHPFHGTWPNPSANRCMDGGS